MRPINLQRITKLYLSTVFLAGAISAAAANSDMHLTGLALHQETGRNIYLGGIFFDQHVAKPDDIVNASGPKMMEYRVVARRTSIRSLLGGILLQSELANGYPPNESVSSFANDILNAVKGSLYAGDSLEILLNENDETVAYLNGHELVRIQDGKVSDYILVGWIGEQGPSTTFRNSIKADEVDPTLLQIFEANTYTAERGLEVANWLEASDTSADKAVVVADNTGETEAETVMDNTEPPEQEELAEVPAVTTEVTVAVDWEDEVNTVQDIKGQHIMATSAANIDIERAPANEPMISQPKPKAVTQAPPAPVSETKLEDATQVASLHATSDMLGASAPEGVEALDIQDYSERLGQFNTRLIRSVYGEIQYPRQAVRRNLQGRLELDVTLQQDGTLVDISVGQSSGFKILDKAAVRAARKALTSIGPDQMDPVAIAEYGGADNKLVVPVPVQFLLTE